MKHSFRFFLIWDPTGGEGGEYSPPCCLCQYPLQERDGGTAPWWSGSHTTTCPVLWWVICTALCWTRIIRSL